VIMYFTPEAARALIQRLASALAPGGFLFLGPAETLRGISQAFAMRASHDTFYYQRGDQLWESTAPEPASPSTWLPPPPALPPVDGAWFDQIARASERITALAEATLHGEPPAAETAPFDPDEALRLALVLVDSGDI